MASKKKLTSALTTGAVVLFASASVTAAPLIVGADLHYAADRAAATSHTTQLGPDWSAEDCVCGWECEEDCDCDCDCGDCDDKECDCN